MYPLPTTSPRKKMKNIPPSKKKKNFPPPPKNFVLLLLFKSKIWNIRLIKPLGVKPLEARGEAASISYSVQHFKTNTYLLILKSQQKLKIIHTCILSCFALSLSKLAAASAVKETLSSCINSRKSLDLFSDPLKEYVN